ncbi:MAG TPA: NUDIX hydrolase [Tepidisphaeraceae bacterium]|jgi:ADP-ribose pyrophosphatase|nr:NUDIX hydrolase [Tepidisphaeraceae bacterium]
MAFQVIEKQVLYKGNKINLEVHHLQDDSGKRTQREVVVHPGAVVILPFFDDKTILLIRNKRYTIQQILLELPAGTLEAGESPMNCAGRELQEETGYLASRMKPIGNFYSSPGIMTERMYAFAAFGLKRTSPALEEDEEIEVFSVDFSDAVSMIRDGQIQDGKTIATLLLYERFFAQESTR